MTAFQTLELYLVAALAEIAGCFAVRAWMRLRASVRWLAPGLFSLAAFAWQSSVNSRGDQSASGAEATSVMASSA